MRKFRSFIGGYLLILLIAAIGLIACCGCENLGIKKTEVIDKEYADSIIAESIQNYTNPLFMSVDEAIEFRNLTVDSNTIDQAFLEMPEDVLRNVVSVCLKRDGYASKRSIIYEYRANAEVYNNLPKSTAKPTNDTIKNQNTSAGGEPYRRDSASKGDTVINGKSYKAL